MKNKIIILIILVLSITVILTIISISNRGTKETSSENSENTMLEDYIETLEDNTLKNNSEELKKNKEIDGLVISNIRVTAKNGETVIMMDIQNNSKKIKGNKEVTLMMLDKDKNEIGKIGVNLSVLKENKAMTLEIKTETNFINTYDFIIIDKPIIDIIEE